MCINLSFNVKKPQIMCINRIKSLHQIFLIAILETKENSKIEGKFFPQLFSCEILLFKNIFFP